MSLWGLTAIVGRAYTVKEIVGLPDTDAVGDPLTVIVDVPGVDPDLTVNVPERDPR